MNLPSSLPSVNTASTALGIPLILALLTFQAECRLPPKYVIRGVEKSLFGADKGFSGRLSVEPSLSRKEAYRGRRRRKRRPLTNYVSSYGYPKKSRGRPRRPPPPVQEFPEDFDDQGEEPGYTEERPVRTRPWSNHLYSASIRSREPSRPRPPAEFYTRYRGKKPRPQQLGQGLTYFSREPEDLDPRWKEYREDFPPRNPEWDLDDPSWDSERVRNQVRDDYNNRYYGKSPPWRDNREILRPQNFKKSPWNNEGGRETMQTQQMSAYQVWSEDPGNQDDIEVQVKYPVWMEDSPENLYPGQRGKQRIPSQEGRISKRPAINQDLEAHVLQPAKSKTKFRSGIGQNVRGQNKDINWEMETAYQNLKTPDLNWEDPKPFESQNPQWTEKKPSKNYQWNQKKGAVSNKEGQWDEQNKDFAWSADTSSTTNQEPYWTDSTTSTSQAYPHWDNSQQFYHDRSLRQQTSAQAKMDVIEEDHDSSSEHKLAASK